MLVARAGGLAPLPKEAWRYFFTASFSGAPVRLSLIGKKVVFEILQQRKFLTFILRDRAARSEIEVVPERGGIITRWRIQQQDILYLDEERFANPQLTIRGGIPILFPICGNLPDNTYKYNGRQYTLKQHGFARDLPWQVEQVVAEENKAFLKLHLHDNEQTQAVYPFNFHLSFCYQIQGNTLEIRQQFYNSSSTPMPFSVGFHPYFLTRDKTQLKFDIPCREYQQQQTKEVHVFDGSFDFHRDEVDVAFKQLQSTSATVTDHSRNLKLTLEFDNFFSTLVFWTVKGKEFYCLEPWSAPRNAINTGEYLTVLAPRTGHAATFRLRVNFF